MPDLSPEQREYVVDSKLVPLGYEQNTTLTTATSLKPPTDTRVAVIQAIANDVRWRDDGTSPTSTVGMLLAAGRDMLYVGDFAKLEFIEVTATAELNVSYYQ